MVDWSSMVDWLVCNGVAVGRSVSMPNCSMTGNVSIGSSQEGKESDEAL